DLEQLLSAKTNFGIYAVGMGDVIEVQMPTIITAVSPKTYKDQIRQVEPYLCRVSDSGTITVPILGEINVDGKTLAQIEAELVSGYYPKYVIERPSVVCSVKEYHLKNITVVGAVLQPGVYQLKSNEMSLVAALMKAGGIVESGASVIMIKNPQRNYVNHQTSHTSVKQFAELDEQYIEFIDSPAENTAADFSALTFDLAFQPESSNSTAGNLNIQRGNEIIYGKKINIKNQDDRIEYVKELRGVIGYEQSQIIEKAIEQLAAQLSPAIAASGVKQFGKEDIELLEAADEFGSTKKNTGCPGCDKKYIEAQPAAETKFTPIEVIDETPVAEQANSEPVYTAAAEAEPIILPVKGLNIPFADVSLMDGDLIEVKRLDPQVFTVIGLAKTPGAFPYPPDVEYNLMQALGFAGGADLAVDPRFVTVYRQDARDEVVSATFRIDNKFMAKAYDVKIKPGDVISVDVTPRTRRNMILNQMLRINFGLFINPFNND
ncbi:MAG: polysaccharide biosynthesis/export family protein, partial [Phycisphaerae bacterium]|nr:polysaccharide biosynthesis/export family protein [Phycisphaerae bacterium]